MYVRIFTLRFNPATEGFDDSHVTGFLADKEVAAIRDYFFERDGAQYLSLVVHYRTGIPSAAIEAKSDQQRDESWRTVLAESDWPLFKTLRAWRSERSKQEGVPPYVICNNRQLTKVTKARPTTLAALGAIEGFGEAKLKKYGKDLLSLIAGAAPSPEVANAAAG